MRLTFILQDFKKVGELTKQYSNLPDSYIKRSMEQIIYRTPDKPNYLRRSVGKKQIKFTENRPWTIQSKLENTLFTKTPVIYVEPIRDWSIFKGDRVEILVGRDKGKQGIVIQVIQERNWVLVGNLNMKITTMKMFKRKPSTVIREEQPLRVTDQVSLIDPSDMLPCKIEWRYTEEGEKVRVSLRSGRIIPIPILAKETYDYKTRTSYEEKDKDTTADVVSKITFTPRLCTFEMDLMDKVGIKEDRIPSPVYWY